MIRITYRKDGVTQVFYHANAVQAVPNEDWLYVYDEAGQICSMYFSANVVQVAMIEMKAGEQPMNDENSDKTPG